MPTSGQRAEQVAAAFLQENGYKLLAQNWRTRWCEIDIVAQKAQAIYFVEVKYRANARHGTGLDYITPKKLAQMHFAAEFWLSIHGGRAQDYRLAALEVGGPAFAVTQWLDDV